METWMSEAHSSFSGSAWVRINLMHQSPVARVEGFGIGVYCMELVSSIRTDWFFQNSICSAFEEIQNSNVVVESPTSFVEGR